MSHSSEAANLPYGVTHFLRVGQAQTSLGIGKDTLARRVESRLHRLVLANGNRLFPVGFIDGLVSFIHKYPNAADTPMATMAREYTFTDKAQNEILRAEIQFEAAFDSNLAYSGIERVVSARAIGNLLGFQRATVIKDWAMRPNMLPATDIGSADLPPDTYFAEQSFRDFYTWHRPNLES